MIAVALLIAALAVVALARVVVVALLGVVEDVNLTLIKFLISPSILNGQGETRTLTTSGRHILSVVRLPIPPLALSLIIITALMSF